MAVKNRDELFSDLTNILGDNTSEEALQFLENFTDTFASLEETGNDARVAELEQKLEDLNETWSKRYKERFFSGGRVNALTDPEDIEEEQSLVNEDIRIDDLFKDEKPSDKPNE